MAWLMRSSLSKANVLGFVAGAALNAWLKMSQLHHATIRTLEFLWRLLFVSLLAFFLRGGVLWTLAGAIGLPPLVSIVLAIIAGWTVLFSGYALFIWPARDQYGSGVRWRVASICATAYLLALRVAYLCAMPVDRRLAAMSAVPGSPGNLNAGARTILHLRDLGATLLGPNWAGINLPALLCWLVAAWAVFQTAKRIFDKTIAFRALLLFSALPVFFSTGSAFSPASLILAEWALFLWLMTLLRGSRLLQNAAILAAVLFCWNFVPWFFYTDGSLSVWVRLLIFVPCQALLVTPVALIAVPGTFSGCSCAYAQSLTGEQRAACRISLAFSTLAFGLTFWGFIAAGLGIMASGAIWLPLLPFIAARMQKPGGPPSRWWGPVLCVCVVFYGLYYYALAFTVHW
jgi:hypothetical protein